MTCGIPSGHHWRRVAPPPEPRRNSDPRPTTYEEWEDLEADRDRLAAELERVRSAMEIGRGELVFLRDNFDHEPDEHYNRHDCRCCMAEAAVMAMDRAALAQTDERKDGA